MRTIITETRTRMFYRLFFLCVLGVAIVLRVPHLFVDRLWPDEALYAWNAKRIFLHPELIFSKEIVDFHPPFFSVLLSLTHWFFDPLLACHVMVFFINILGIAGIYFLGVKIQGRFLGCFAAAMLSFNILYFFMSGYLLIDGALTAFMVVFFYALSFVSRPKISAEDLSVGLSGAVLILLKWSGGLVLPLIGLYYIFGLRELTLRQRLMKVLIPLGICVVLVAALLAHNYALLGSWFPKVFGPADKQYQQPVLFYFQQLVWYVISWHVVPVFLYGLWLTFKSRNRHYWVHGLWVVFALVTISLMPQKDVRFMMPVFPSMILIMGIALEDLLTRLEKRAGLAMLKPLFLIVVFGLFITYYYPKVERYMVKKSFSYVGYRTAAQYIKEQLALAPDTRIMAGAARILRYNTDINYEEFGGRLSLIPQDENTFVRKLTEINAPIILVVDLWEWSQPSWVYPLDERKAEFLNANGFELEATIREKILVEKGLFDMRDVVWCFRRRVSDPL